MPVRKAKRKRARKEEKLVAALRDIWDSLDSHLDKIGWRDGAFHRKTIKGYARDIEAMADFL